MFMIRSLLDILEIMRKENLPNNTFKLLVNHFIHIDILCVIYTIRIYPLS